MDLSDNSEVGVGGGLLLNPLSHQLSIPPPDLTYQTEQGENPPQTIHPSPVNQSIKVLKEKRGRGGDQWSRICVRVV